MLVYYISEIKKSFVLLIPLFLAYGILSKFNFAYYIWMPIMMLIITLVPVLVGGLLSIPTNYIMRFLNRFQYVKIALLVILLAAILTGVGFVISIIPKDINLIKMWSYVSQFIRSFLSNFVNMFMPFYIVCIFLCGKYENMENKLFTNYSWIVLLILIGAIALLSAINMLASRPLYLHMITKQFEFNKDEKIRKKKNNRINSTLSACVYETKRCLRDTSRVSMSLGILLIGSIAVLLLNIIYSAINTRLIGDYLSMSFNILIILLFTLSHNINVASIYSQDGEALVLNKTKPQHPWNILFPRVTYNVITSTIILITLSSMFFSSKACILKPGECILAFFMMLFITFAHIIWSADFDFMHPQANIFKTEGAAGINPNEVKSAILTFFLAAAGFGLTFFFITDPSKGAWVKLFFIALALLLLRVFLFAKKSKTLYKEL